MLTSGRDIGGNALWFTERGRLPGQPRIDTSRWQTVVIWWRRETDPLAPPGTIEATMTAVEKAITGNRDKAEAADTLDELGKTLLDLINSAETIAKDRLDRQRARCNAQPSLITPTIIGNARHLSEIYSKNVYNVDFGFLWRRIRTVIPETDYVARQLDAARAQLDFAVLSLIGITATTVAWAVILLANLRLWPLLLLSAFGTAMTWLFHLLVVESQKGLGEVAQAAVDRFRFELLKSLHIDLPKTLDDERKIWSTLAAIADGRAPNANMDWTHS